MESDPVAIQEAILSLRKVNTQTVAILVTVQITLFFGFFGAIYIFLRHLGIWVRAAALFFYALAHLYLVLPHSVLHEVNDRILDWQSEAIRNKQLPDYFTAESVVQYQSVAPYFDVILGLLNFGSLLFLIYMIFIHKWEKRAVNVKSKALNIEKL